MTKENKPQMSPQEFETYLTGLTNDQYDALMQERIARLAPEEQLLAQARESQRKDRFKLFEKLIEPNADENVHHMVFDILRDMERDTCEHGRANAKPCLACGKMDHIMFPELFDEDGFHRLDQPNW
jgi:hypothetical protein